MFNFIASIFGYILNFIYSLVQNYGIAIIIFSVFLKLLLLPMSIKQQKTMKKTAKVQVKVKELQEKYKNDPQKMNQEVMDLYKRENVSPLGGCLPAILQILFLIAMFVLVRNPITHMLKIEQSTINNVKNYMVSNEENVNQSYPEISVLKYVSKNKENAIDIIEETDNSESEEEEKITEKIELKDLYINMNFLSLDLSNIPIENWDDWTVFIIPALYVITSIASLRLTSKLTSSSSKKSDDVIEIQKVENGEEKDNKKDEMSPEEMGAQMSKSMTWFMPIMSVSIATVAPLGLALYWLVNNLLMILERIILNKLIKTDEGEENE